MNLIAEEVITRREQVRGSGGASAALPLLDDDTASPASRRLASAHAALAPKCNLNLLTGLKSRGAIPGFLVSAQKRYGKEQNQLGIPEEIRDDFVWRNME